VSPIAFSGEFHAREWIRSSSLRLSSVWNIALHERRLAKLSAAAAARRRHAENAEVVCGLLPPDRGTIQIFVSVIRDFMLREQEQTRREALEEMRHTRERERERERRMRRSDLPFLMVVVKKQSIPRAERHAGAI